jgi:hypothetical protein
MNTNTTNRSGGKHAYLIYLAGNYQGNQGFTDAWNKVTGKTPIQGLNNAFLVWSDLPVNRFYGFFGGNAGQTTMPVILPIDMNVLQGLGGQTGLPDFLKTFISQGGNTQGVDPQKTQAA